jgi:hypothetical protein
MPFDPASVAFLTRLQAERLGPRGETGISEPDRIADSLSGLLTEEDRQSTFEILFGSETSLPTPYESFHNYSLLSDLALAITVALRKFRDIDEVPMVGTLPIGAPLAFLLRVPDSAGHIVLVDTQFAVFANLLAKAGAQALLPSREMTKDSWSAALDGLEHPAAVRYVELMKATLGDGPVTAPSYLADSYWQSLAGELRTAIEVFVLAEPIAHLAMRHVDAAEPTPLYAVHRDAETYAWTRRQQAECFVMRLRLMEAVFEITGRPNKRLGYWAIELFLFSLALLQTIAARHRGETRRVAARPAEQMAWMREVLRRMEGEQSRSAALLERLAPIKLAFARHLNSALSQTEGD